MVLWTSRRHARSPQPAMTTPATSQPQQEAEVHAQFEPGSERPVEPTVQAVWNDLEEHNASAYDMDQHALRIESELAEYKAHFEACERRRMLTAEERDQARDDLRTTCRALAAERKLAAQTRELLSDSADKFVKGSDLLLQIPEGRV